MPVQAGKHIAVRPDPVDSLLNSLSQNSSKEVSKDGFESVVGELCGRIHLRPTVFTRVFRAEERCNFNESSEILLPFLLLHSLLSLVHPLSPASELLAASISPSSMRKPRNFTSLPNHSLKL